MISRAIIGEVNAGRALDGPYGKYVHLDLTHLGEAVIMSKLPFVRELATTYVGVDPVYEPIPIRPVVHYMMGGVDVDIDGCTQLPGLYAAGEVASVSLNGANRLGSNSLTECLVFGARSGIHATEFARGSSAGSDDVLRRQAEEEAARIDALRGSKRGDEQIAQIRRDMNSAMEDGCGVYRVQETMAKTVRDLADMKPRADALALKDASRVFNTEIIAALELGNMLEVAEAVAHAAVVRKESRGAHACSDFPARNDPEYLHHSLVYRGDPAPRVEKKTVTLGTWEPEERKY
jgi:fumarate reductase flavoprotein subunit